MSDRPRAARSGSDLPRDVDEVFSLAQRLARAAGAIQRDSYEHEVRIATKSAPIDLVTEVDHRCEQMLVEEIERSRPDDAIVAEEGRGTDREGAAWRWIIDPLDGTTNFAHGYPRFCVSIGVEHADVRTVGVVYDPLLDELFAAVRGRGATRNGHALRVSAETELSRALVATGFAYDVHRSEYDNVDHFNAFVKNARAIRRDGSAALDLCYVAAGRLDGYWELKLHAWDVAAGILCVEEAGGRVTDASGNPAPRDGREIVSSNGGIHGAMLALLATPPV